MFHSLTLHFDISTMQPTCVLWEETPRVPPDCMLAIWEELWDSMLQSGRVSVTVNSLLQNYKERCRDEKK